MQFGSGILRAKIASAMKKRTLSTKVLGCPFFTHSVAVRSQPGRIADSSTSCNTGLPQSACDTPTVPDGAKSNCYSEQCPKVRV
jgi:hypothetical protein